MKAYELRKELRTLVAKIESGGPDIGRLRALDGIFRLRNESSTPSALRAFYGVVSQKKILRLTKLAVERSVVLGPDAERLLEKLAAWAKEYDPGPDLAAAAIRRGDEKEILPIIEAIVAELDCETQSTRAWLAAMLKSRGKDRVGALGDIVVRRSGSETARSYAQALLHAIRCPECSRDQKNVWCTCGCRRRLCKRCEEVDQTTVLILRELARSA